MIVTQKRGARQDKSVLGRRDHHFDVLQFRDCIPVGTPKQCPLFCMIIYGTALLALCHLAGIVLGDLLGKALGVKTNVGGVGIAMLLLIMARLYLHKRGMLGATSEKGVHYWGAIYIPVVVAMAAQQNVVTALNGTGLALLAALGSVAVCGLLVAFINRMEPQADASLLPEEER